MADLYLHHAPIPESLHVYLNSIEARAGIDYDYLTGPPRVTPKSAWDVRSGDLMEAQYAWSSLDTSGGAGATPDPAPGPGSKGGNTYPGAPIPLKDKWKNYQPVNCPDSVNYFPNAGNPAGVAPMGTPAPYVPLVPMALLSTTAVFGKVGPQTASYSFQFVSNAVSGHGTELSPGGESVQLFQTSGYGYNPGTNSGGFNFAGASNPRSFHHYQVVKDSGTSVPSSFEGNGVLEVSSSRSNTGGTGKILHIDLLDYGFNPATGKNEDGGVIATLYPRAITKMVINAYYQDVTTGCMSVENVLTVDDVTIYGGSLTTLSPATFNAPANSRLVRFIATLWDPTTTDLTTATRQVGAEAGIGPNE